MGPIGAGGIILELDVMCWWCVVRGITSFGEGVIMVGGKSWPRPAGNKF